MKSQKGFGAIELIFAFIVLLLVVVAGGLVYKNHHDNYTLKAQAAKTAATSKFYIDPTKIYSLTYPSSWAVTSSVGGYPKDATYPPYISEYIERANFTSPDAPIYYDSAKNGIVINVYRTADTTTLLGQTYPQEQGTIPENLTINGYPAVYYQEVQNASLNLTAEVYGVTHNGVTVTFYFIEKRAAINATQNAPAQPAFNETNLVPAFNTLVKSVKFLN